MVFFSRLAEIAGEYLRKGSQVYIDVFGADCIGINTQLVFQSFYDGLGYLILDSEDVAKFTIIGLRPDMESVARIDKLGGDADRVTCLSYAAFQH